MQSNDWVENRRLEKRLISAVVSTDETRMKDRTLISSCALIFELAPSVQNAYRVGVEHFTKENTKCFEIV